MERSSGSWGHLRMGVWLIVVLGVWLIASPSAALYRQPLCSSWRFNVEVNNLRGWSLVPDECEHYVAAYITGSGYKTDSAEATSIATDYAHSFLASADSSARDAHSSAHYAPSFLAFAHSSAHYAWVLDIDETSLSNAPFYAHHRFGAEAYNDTLFNEWVEKAAAPVLPGTLRLFKTLKDLKYFVFFLTGRLEEQRNATVANLERAGYSEWDGLILRQTEDIGVVAAVYKSSKRKSLEDLGYTIVGNVGDQWSDLSGYSVGDRVFKLPNPMYYIP